MKCVGFAAIAIIPSVAAAQTNAQQPLNLTCLGGGSANKATGATAFSRFGTATIIGRSREGFNDQVDLRLFAGDDRIRLPRTMLPAWHGGEDGWFKLKNVKADTRTIRGEAAVNFANHPKVYIDRVTGTISITGNVGSFSGECQVDDANAPAKF